VKKMKNGSGKLDGMEKDGKLEIRSGIIKVN
jgi:hypothetical protein